MIPNIISPVSARNWGLLILVSVPVCVVLTLIGLPASLLLGTMGSGIVLAVAGLRHDVPKVPFLYAQGLLGCMIASSIPFSVTAGLLTDWPLILIGVFTSIGAGVLMGWLVSQSGRLPGTTAVWGLMPGAASLMTLMAESYGADMRLVAFMQYTRVLMVAMAAALTAHAIGAGTQEAAGLAAWFPEVRWGPLLATLLLAASSPVIVLTTGFTPAGLLFPIGAGMVLAHFGVMSIELPPWLLAIAYALIGWRIGLRFTAPLLRHALSTLPMTIAATAALMAICAVAAVLLWAFAGIDFLSAYLATSPGGADTVAIIAASTHVDVSFVMTLQMTRLLVLMFIGPVIARGAATMALRSLAKRGAGLDN